MDNIEVSLRDAIDEAIAFQTWKHQTQVPLALAELYRFHEIKLLDVRCVFLEALQEWPRLESIQKHLVALSKVDDAHFVLCFKNLSAFRRKTLLQHRISFVTEEGQIYLPFLTLKLQKTPKREKQRNKQFAATTQLVFLHFLYHKDINVNATELADRLSINIMAASRSLNELYDNNLLNYVTGGKTGRSKIYLRIGDPEYYRLGSPFLKDPVQKTIYLREHIDGALISGLEALSHLSMVNPPSRPIRAIHKNRFVESARPVVEDPEWQVNARPVELQLWKYDPTRLSNQGVVDLLSLKLSLQNETDDRVVQALEELLGREPWYME